MVEKIRWDRRGLALLTAFSLALAATVLALSPAQADQRLAVGDSILLAAQGDFQRLGYRVDARYGRPFDEGLRVIRAQADSLPPVVFVHLGTNSPVTADECGELVSLVGPQRSLTLATVRIPQHPGIAAENNRVLAACAAAHGNVRLLDWAGYVAANPGVVCGDGIHISCGGTGSYTAFITGSVLAPAAPGPPAPEEPATPAPAPAPPRAATGSTSSAGSSGAVADGGTRPLPSARRARRRPLAPRWSGLRQPPPRRTGKSGSGSTGCSRRAGWSR